MVSRWALVVRGRLADGDVEADGSAPAEVVERLVREGCAGYLGLVSSLAGAETSVAVAAVRPLAVGGARTLLVAASAVEVYEDSFTVAVRLRPLGEGDAGDFRCRVTLAGGGALPAEVRSELIAIEKEANRPA